MSKDKPTSSEYKTINVDAYHIRNGSPGEADCCAIALALQDQFLDEPNKEWVRVDGGTHIYKGFMIGNDNYEHSIRVHPNDLEEVGNFIDWFDDKAYTDYDFESITDEDLEPHTITFRVKELF